MNRTPSYTQPLADCRDTSLVGGKAANLGRLIRAGFPVPDGFVVTTRAFRFAQAQSPDGRLADTLPVAVADEVCQAYRGMGCGPGGSPLFGNRRGRRRRLDGGTIRDVARCPGRRETSRRRATMLGEPRCPPGLGLSPRARIDPAGVAMAVVVQRLVPADVAGVLFTTNPHDGRHREMLVEAGLGIGRIGRLRLRSSRTRCG